MESSSNLSRLNTLCFSFEKNSIKVANLGKLEEKFDIANPIFSIENIWAFYQRNFHDIKEKYIKFRHPIKKDYNYAYFDAFDSIHVIKILL